MTVERTLIPAAKRHAEEQGRSLSSFIEEALREMVGEVRHRRVFVAWHSLSNLWYLLRPRLGRDSVRRFLGELTELAAVAPTGTDDFRWAAALALTDLEEAMRVAAARSCGAEHIATWNVRDYEGSPGPARTPAELLEVLG